MSICFRRVALGAFGCGSSAWNATFRHVLTKARFREVSSSSRMLQLSTFSEDGQKSDSPLKEELRNTTAECRSIGMEERFHLVKEKLSKIVSDLQAKVRAKDQAGKTEKDLNYAEQEPISPSVEAVEGEAITKEPLGKLPKVEKMQLQFTCKVCSTRNKKVCKAKKGFIKLI